MRHKAAPLDPTPESLERIRAAADSLKADAAGDDEWTTHYPVYVSHHHRRLALDLDIVERYLPLDAEVCEVGSLPPVLTVALTRQGRSVTGVDLNPERFRRSIFAHGLRILRCDIETEQLPFPDASFDALIVNEVFEHLRFDLPATFRELRRITRPGGTLLLSTPNLRSIHGIVNLVFRGHGYALCGDIYDEYQKLQTHGHMGHVREYAAGDVARFLGKVGFPVTTVIHRPSNRRRTLGTRASALLLPRLRPFASFVARAA